ncbi:hypothetical protein [Vitreimonas flagellata]|uniref:hypothetical protein n=1 Tax=Vitreimonas flagellata TaxID=2560861 RepID=UPI001074DCED|nr:hypothetical protein [Vitreimonas flagellata]
MNAADITALIEAANRAPSVHNIQPTRFRIDDERTITLLEDTSRRLFVGDPEGKDNQKSLGAAFEGLMLALAAHGFGADIEKLSGAGALRETARIRIATGGVADALEPLTHTRASYRGAFAPPTEADRSALAQIAETCPDLHILQGADALQHVGRVFDDASMEVLRAPAYRAELLSWMRLSPKHPDYERDGLNAAHMALSPIEAFGAGLVLGPKAFPALDSIGLAEPLISESGKVGSAAGVALFHRPTDEPEFETGRRFYRVWLEIERAGLALCPMSVLADVPHVAQRLMRENGIGSDRKLVTAFRIGRRPSTWKQPPRTRLPVSELIVRAA